MRMFIPSLLLLCITASIANNALMRRRDLELPSTLSDADKNAILTAHNDYRRKTAKGEDTGLNDKKHPIATNMVELQWDEALAKVASDWAAKCTKSGHHPDEARRAAMQAAKTDGLGSFSYTYNEPYNRNTFEEYLGENMGWTSDAPTMEGFIGRVAAWNGESASYSMAATHGEAQCTLKTGTYNECGHFTQVVWANTVYVGCGFHDCTGTTNGGGQFVCNYYNAGNLPSAEVYKQGTTTCSACPSGYTKCNDGLCSQTTGTDITAPAPDPAPLPVPAPVPATEPGTEPATSYPHKYEDNKCVVDGVTTACDYANFGPIKAASVTHEGCTFTDEGEKRLKESVISFLDGTLNDWNFKVVLGGIAAGYTQSTISVSGNMMHSQYVKLSSTTEFTSKSASAFKSAFGCTSASDLTPIVNVEPNEEPKEEPYVVRNPWNENPNEEGPWNRPNQWNEKPYVEAKPWNETPYVEKPSGDSNLMQYLLMAGFVLVLYNIGCCYVIANGAGSKVQRFKEVYYG